MNNAMQRQNKVIIFNVEFRSVEERQSNVVNMSISKKNKIIYVSFK